MGRARSEQAPFGKRPFYKTYPYHLPSLRTKLSRRRPNFSLPLRRRRTSQEGFRVMDLLRTFYTLTQTSTITRESLIFRLHTKATVVILVTLTIIITTRQYVGNPIDCIHTRSENSNEGKNTVVKFRFLVENFITGDQEVDFTKKIQVSQNTSNSTSFSPETGGEFNKLMKKH
ncbi:hypothetical protein D910_04915 [Dendroctonus ponderosae]|uniref:Innexin n=1 Tax=Dendroctonus ponderosae TaxID=77166 RepID=U4U5B6_DENPD|nr:hypothetical protein D910_04915 [Dendroctonus ponderosae]